MIAYITIWRKWEFYLAEYFLYLRILHYVYSNTHIKRTNSNFKLFICHSICLKLCSLVQKTCLKSELNNLKVFTVKLQVGVYLNPVKSFSLQFSVTDFCFEIFFNLNMFTWCGWVERILYL